MNHPRVRWTIALFALSAAFGYVGWRFARGPDRPSILLVTLDTTRADRLGCYGYAAAATPTIDELASRGILFESAYTPVPLTLPSHATMLTGLLPPEHGLHLNGQGRLDPQIPLLAEHFSREGYATSAFIASFILHSTFGLDRGFEVYNDDLQGAEKGDHAAHRLRSGRQIVDAALAWLRAPRRQPFFSWVHLVDPHLPCQEHPAEFGARFRGRAYDAEVAYADTQIHRLIEHLRATGELERTLIVIAGDHGEGLGEHGETEHGYMVYNATMRVPLVIHAPRMFNQPRRVSEPVSLVDLFPTLLDCAGMSVPKAIGGRSLKPTCKGALLAERPCYGESDAPLAEGGWSPLRSLTTKKWKFIHTARPELYDLETDPNELTNLIGQHPDEVADLEGQLAALEASFERRGAQSAALSESDQKLLSGLGYIGQPTTVPNPTKDKPVRDIKEVIAFPERVEQGMGLISAGKLEQAEEMLRAVVAAVPDYPKALGTLGVCLAGQKKTDEAVQLFEQALLLDPSLDFAQFSYGRLLFEKNEHAAARKHLMEAIRRNPQAPVSHYYYGEASRRLGDMDEALKGFKAAISLNPDFAQAKLGLGDLALSAGDVEQAVAHFRSAIQSNPRQADPHERLAAALVRARQYREAVDSYTAAFERDPKHLASLVGLAKLLASCGDSRVRDGARGIRMAERACRITQSEAVEPLDALAAAYAEAGQWDQAIDTAEKALALARATGAADVADIAARLEGYRARTPCRMAD